MIRRTCLPSTLRLMPVIHESTSVNSKPSLTAMTWSVQALAPVAVASMRVRPRSRAKRISPVTQSALYSAARGKLPSPACGPITISKFGKPSARMPRKVNGVRLKDKWKDGPQTFLGILAEGFPNLLMVMGPHAGLGNFPRAAEYSVEWVTGLVRHARDYGLTRIEATQAGVAHWTEHVKSLGEGLLMNEIDSWMTGVNRNVEGKQTRKIMRYSGGHPAFREHCDAVAVDGYRKLALA